MTLIIMMHLAIVSSGSVLICLICGLCRCCRSVAVERKMIAEVLWQDEGVAKTLDGLQENRNFKCVEVV